MVRLIDLGLERLHSALNQMFELSSKVMDVLVERGPDAVNEIESISTKLRELKEEVHDIAIEIIVRYQPLASDLRDLKSALEISYGLYRISRYVLDTARVFADSGLNYGQCFKEPVKDVTMKVREMLSLTFKAFKERDAIAASKVIGMDEEIDAAFRQFFAKAIKCADPCDAADLMVMKYLERLADHCVYIAEDLLFALGKTRK
ncbi:MAG: phosphate signaling complex PhoU family protein [Thermoprotei archaeon]